MVEWTRKACSLGACLPAQGPSPIQFGGTIMMQSRLGKQSQNIASFTWGLILWVVVVLSSCFSTSQRGH